MTLPPTRPRRRLALLLLASAGAVGGAARPALAEGPTLAQHLEEKAKAIVTLRVVLQVRMTFGGQTQEREQKGDMHGVTVDPSGLVMLEDGSSQARAFTRRFGGRLSVDYTPVSIQVSYGNEAKEHEAVLVARDTILGLAFVQVVDLEGRTPAAVDLSGAAEPRIGQALFSVSRLPRGFDSAPHLGRLYPSMRVTQPRPMWGVTGDSSGTGLPVFDMTGKPVGVLAFQEGAEGSDLDGHGPDGGTFLLPLATVAKSVEAAKKRVPDALAKAKAAKEAPKEPEAPPAPAMDGEPAMGEPPAPPSDPDKPR
jgi:hypothetical protein